MLSGKNLTMVESDEFSFLVSDVDIGLRPFSWRVFTEI